jgi:hypothetical protein
MPHVAGPHDFESNLTSSHISDLRDRLGLIQVNDVDRDCLAVPAPAARAPFRTLRPFDAWMARAGGTKATVGKARRSSTCGTRWASVFQNSERSVGSAFVLNKSEGLVTLTFASWHRLVEWFRQLEALRETTTLRFG